MKWEKTLDIFIRVVLIKNKKNLQFVGGVTLGHFHPFCFHFLNNANLQRDITYVGGEINKVSH